MRATDQAAAGKSLTPPLARAQEPENPDRLEILDAPGVPMRDTHLRNMNLRGWNTGAAIMARNGCVGSRAKSVILYTLIALRWQRRLLL